MVTSWAKPSMSQTESCRGKNSFLCLVEFKYNLLQIAEVLTQCYCVMLQWAIGWLEWQSDIENNGFWAKKLSNNFAAWRHLLLSLKWVTINVQGQEVWWIISPNILIFGQILGSELTWKYLIWWVSVPLHESWVRQDWLSKQREYIVKCVDYIFLILFTAAWVDLMVFLCARVSSLKSEVNKFCSLLFVGT